MDWGCKTVSLLLALCILLATVHRGDAERKVVCYYTNWSIYRPGTAKFSPQNINPYLCTHLIYAFGGFTKENALKPFDKYQDIEKGGYAKFTGLKTYNKNLKTLLAIGGWNEGSSRFSPMVADQDRRREFVKNSVKFLRKNHFDGLDLDWEYPAFRDGGKPRDKDNYASLVQELREEFDKESSKTGRPRLLLSLAMPAGIEYIDKGYDVPRLNEYLDFINLLSYDYHSSYEPAVNHHSPLYPLEEDNEYNYDSELTIDYTINYLLKKGASPEKIILGIPTYGRSYTLFNRDATELGAPADGPGTEGDATREKGYLAYYEICESLSQSDDWEVVQPNSKAMGPYAFKDDQWVGYDDEDIVKLKAKYANEKNLGGIMFWTIDNDDFRGKCHDRPYPLIEAAKQALLTDSTNAVQKSQSGDNRKKTRLPTVPSNSGGRRQGSGSRRSTTTAAPITKKRVTSPRPKFRTYARPKASREEDEEDQDVYRRSYSQSSSEEDDSDKGNAVKAEKNDRSREKGKSRPKNQSIGSSSRNRRKQTRRKQKKNESEEESLSNQLTTPEPPTTPDPGTDFKCEDEGFFPHPRDCKKYFWCLDSGPGGLGVVAHQFTCPSGLVFNKAADSCDYPRNVICPKTKTSSQATASTTRAPITAATSRTTYLYSSTRKPTTEKPEEEEYEDDYEGEDESEEEEQVEEKKEPSTTTTPKPLLYKTITRNKPTTTTTTTTEAPQVTKKSESHEESVKILGTEDEEDPKVIKELIMLIKKAGGIEELEKQLYLQSKGSDETSVDTERVTPATISRSLYERVLNRQSTKVATSRASISRGTSYANGPGGAQFEGLDEVPEVKNLRRSQKPQYVTIERPRPSTKEPPVEDEEEVEDDEELDDDTADVASSEERTVSNPFLASSTQRATPNYFNIRRARPSSTTSRNENDVELKDDEEEEAPVRSRRPTTPSRSTENSSSEDKEEESRNSSEENPTTKSRYVNIQRFRSTTSRPLEVVSESSASPDPVTQAVSIGKEEEKVETSTATSTSTPSSTTVAFTTANSIVVEEETERSGTNESAEAISSSTTETVRLVEDSATEILLTTAPAGLSSTLSAPNSRSSAATVSQPRPFGLSRRSRPTTEPTTPLPGSKVAGSEAIRLPTLKELIGLRTSELADNSSPVQLSLLDNRETNLVLEVDEDNARGEASVPEQPGYQKDGAWILTKAKQAELDPIEDKARLYFEEENVADEAESSLASKKRIDREDSSTTTIRPTTLRATPLTHLPKNLTNPRGFYVTRSQTETPASFTETETFATEPTTLSIGEDNRTEKSTEVPTSLNTEVSSVYTGPSETTTQRSRRRNTTSSSTQTPSSTDYPTTRQVVRGRGRTRHRATIPPVKQEESVSEPITVPTTIKASSSTALKASTGSTLVVTSIVESTIAPTTDVEASVTYKSPNDFPSSSTEEADQTSTEISTVEDIVTETLTTPKEPGPEEKSTASTEKEPTTKEDQNPTTLIVTLPTTTANTKTPGPPARGAQRFNSYEFGRRGSRDRTRVKSPVEDQENSVKRTQPPRRRLYRGRQRRPGAGHVSADSVPEESAPKDLAERNDSSPAKEEHERNVEEQVGIKDSVGRSEPEVNSTRSTVASSRTPGSTSTNRFRKPSGFTLTPPRNKSPNTITANRNNSPTEGFDKLGVTENVPGTAKPEKDIDQSSRAQEIAVTLAEPPLPQTPATGRPSLRDALRRRISTTLSPRTDSTTPRTAVSFSAARKDRQKPKTQDRPQQNATSRPRRPQVIDYDYYEDEEEPVVGKSTFNGKLFLTSQGSIRCLDQGNFPHPYSCRKFITCARMVNGLVIGAEYTCPDKLSYDPVGGICNWSAGLGCKE